MSPLINALPLISNLCLKDHSTLPLLLTTLSHGHLDTMKSVFQLK